MLTSRSTTRIGDQVKGQINTDKRIRSETVKNGHSQTHLTIEKISRQKNRHFPLVICMVVVYQETPDFHKFRDSWYVTGSIYYGQSRILQ